MATDPTIPFQFLPFGQAEASKVGADFDSFLKYIRERNDGTVAWDNLTTSGALISTLTSNQIILGTTRTVTFTAPTPASASRTITFPDLSGNYSVVGTEAAQTINGVKTFGNDTVFSADAYTVAYTDYSATSTVVGWSSFTNKLIYYKKMDTTFI